MSVLVLSLRPRVRLGAETLGAGAEVDYLLSPDGRSVGARGRVRPADLPRADTVVAVLADGDVAWHRLTLPKAPAGRMRQALQGLLEEALLGDDGAAHMALAPRAAAGQPAWVAVADRPHLAGELARLEEAGCHVERVVPMATPGAPPRGHFTTADGGEADPSPALRLCWADDAGQVVWDLAGTLPRQRLPRRDEGDDAAPVRWTAAPNAAAAAEAWLGHAVEVLPDDERLLQAAASPWNLRQFDLAARQRGLRLLREGWRQLLAPPWRPVRWGVLALVAVQLVGLNVRAQVERSAIAERREAMVELLKQTHPQVRTVYEPTLQMTRETDALRAAAGEPGRGDLETLLAATANAWPPGSAALSGLRYEGSRLTLDLAGWDAGRVAALRRALADDGLAVEGSGTQLTVAPGLGAAR